MEISIIQEIRARIKNSVHPAGGWRIPAERIECMDGFSVSIQAGMHNNCTPRLNTAEWTAFELGKPSAQDDLLSRHKAVGEEIYPYVLAETIEKLIEKHGGMKSANADSIHGHWIKPKAGPQLEGRTTGRQNHAQVAS